MDFQEEYQEIKDAIGEQEEKIRKYKEQLRRVQQKLRYGDSPNISLKQLYEDLKSEGWL